MALSDNLVAYWSLDEASGNAIDAHGSNDLAETSGTIGATTGKVSGCRDFEAADTEYFTIADNTDLSTGDINFSFAGWINIESISSFPTFLSKDDNGSNREYGFFINAGNAKVTFYVGFGGSFAVPEWGSALSTATWYFVAGGHNASTNQAWISVNAGTPVTASWSSGVMNGTAPFRLGSRGDSAEYFDGLLDEWGFWKRDIRSDLSELYNAGAGRDYSYITAGGGGGGNRRRRSIICGAAA